MKRQLHSNRAGNMSIMLMGLTLAVVFISGGVIDYMSLVNQKHEVQGLADRAAVAAAREMIVARASNERVQAVAERFVEVDQRDMKAKTTAQIIEKGRAVEVSVMVAPKVYFPGPIGLNAKPVTASATAEIVGGGNVCMIGLDQKAPSTLDMKNKARLTATGCAIYSNSSSDSSLRVHDRARVAADLVCVSGGMSGSKTAVNPAPIEDCPPIEDPLRDRPEPDVGLLKCDYIKAIVLPFQKVKLKPGVYCGGISVVGGQATLEPGVYVMNNGLLSVTAGGKLTGENVGFFLTGALSTILFGYDTEISLTAPRTGPLAGLLFMEDRETIFATHHNIRSNNARRLVGTMYFPKSKLLIDANNPVADKSEYTIILAREFELRDGPELVLRTDYDASPIPVPGGVGDNAEPRIKLVN